MASKANSAKTKSTKSRVSKKAKKSTDKKLFWAFGVLLVVIIAVVGIVWYRDSQAGTRLAYTNSAGWIVTGTGNGSFIDMQWLPNRGIDARATIIGRYNSGVQKYIVRSSHNIGAKDKCVYIGPQGHTIDSALRFKGDNKATNQKYYSGQKINVFVTDSCYD